MAALGNSYLGLIDLFKRQDQSGSIAKIVEILAQSNFILEDAPAIQCNQGMTHLTTTRTGYPTPTWRRLYEGVQPTKSTTAQVTDATGMMEAWSEIDAKLVQLSGDPAAFRLTEAMAFLEGMNNEMASVLFYGNKGANPEKFHGLSPRFDVKSTTINTPGFQIVDAGGSGSDNTSIWMIVWGPATAHLIYPKGTVGGLQRKDIGEETKVDALSAAGLNSVFRVLREQFTWDVGLSVRDFRYIVRIANIDVSEMRAGNVLDIWKWLRKGYWKLHQRITPEGRAAIYCNADVMEAIDAATTGGGSQVAGTSSFVVRTTPDNVAGREIITYRGMPIRQCDALLNTEAQIT